MAYNLKPLWITEDYDKRLTSYGIASPQLRKLLLWSTSGMVAEELSTHTVVPQPLIETIFGSNTPLAEVETRWSTSTTVPIDIVPSNHFCGLAATLRIELPPDLLALHIEACRAGNRDKPEKLNMVTGESWSAYKERKERNAEADEAQAYIATLPAGSQVREMISRLGQPRVGKYVNSLLRENKEGIDVALARLLYSPIFVEYVSQGPLWDRLSRDLGVGPDREQDLVTLWDLCRCGIKTMTGAVGKELAEKFAKLPVVQERMRRWKAYERAHTLLAVNRGPYYRCTCNSPRVFAAGANLMQLPRAVRAAVFAGCWNIDMSQCQLRIVAKIWGIPEVNAYLLKGDPWSNLTADLGVDLSRKDDVKQMIYCTVYGGSKARLKKDHPDLARRFLKHPMVCALWAARERIKDQIAEAGYIVDCNGEIHEVGAVGGKDSKSECIRSLMARQVQSYEFAMMAAGESVVAKDHDMMTVAWLHDGIYVAITNHEDCAAYKVKEIAEAIIAKAKGFGITMNVDSKLLEKSRKSLGD